MSGTSSVNDSFMKNLSPETIINLSIGDPTMYEYYWKILDKEYTVTIHGYQSLSYFANENNFCWFLVPELEEAIKMVHNAVGNAIVGDHHIIVGTGSSQLIFAALYALSEPLNKTDPISVVSAVPYYSSYVEMMDHLRSGLFKWAGDASKFDKDEPYIEMVTSPNNPDGSIREPIINQSKGMLVHDLAYYWPQYTSITSHADHDIMLFTLSKCSGHAGSRIGWALVRDKEVAKKMVKYIEISTIGVSKEAQIRAANILQIISLSCHKNKPLELGNFFEYGKNLLARRWEKLRDVVKNNELFSLPTKYPLQYCNFNKELIESHPAYAWMKCKSVDTEKLLREHKILGRTGMRFGSTAEYVRISMMSRDAEFDLFIQRLSALNGIINEN